MRHTVAAHLAIPTVKKPDADSFPLFCLRAGAFLCFAGWAWVHWYWEGPYGALLWDDSTYDLAESLGLTWEEYVGTGANDGLIQKWISRLFWPYVICTILSLRARSNSWVQQVGLVFGSGLLVALSYAKYVGSQYQVPMFVEHGGQMLMPIILVLALRLGAKHRAAIIAACVALVMTFAGHGSFAAGLWPTPPTFYAMTTVILGVEYETAKLLLLIAGVLDFAVCVAILIPPLRRTAALYAALWGLITALARPVAGMSFDLIHYGADQYIHEAVLRAPHFMIPIYLFFVWRGEGSKGDPAQNHAN